MCRLQPSTIVNLNITNIWINYYHLNKYVAQTFNIPKKPQSYPITVSTLWMNS